MDNQEMLLCGSIRQDIQDIFIMYSDTEIYPNSNPVSKRVLWLMYGMMSCSLTHDVRSVLDGWCSRVWPEIYAERCR